MDKTLGFLAPAFAFLLIFSLNTLLPGRWVTGYINRKNSSEIMRYHLNGIPVFIVLVLTWVVLGLFEIIPFD